MELSNSEIKEILPHRYPFLLIDKVTDYMPGQWAKSVKCVSANEMVFMGHFPEKAVFPGVLLLEALAQTGAIAILSLAENKNKLAVLGGVDKAKFRYQVVPGDMVEMECKMLRFMGSAGKGEAIATVKGQLACKAEFTFAMIDK